MKEKIIKFKKNIHNFKELWKNPRIKSIIVLIFYFFFFFFIIMFLRTNNKTISSEHKKTSGFEFSVEKIKDNNYHYLYDVVFNTSKMIYEGNRYGTKELFTQNDTYKIDTFYNYNEKYLKNINQVWSKIENPYLFSDFKDIYIIEKILKESLQDSKTEYSDKSFLYTYKVSTNNIIRIIENINLDIEDIPNTIMVVTNSNQEVVKIQMDLSSYIHYKSKSTEKQKLNISITYSQFGKIEPIEDPK